eukprot:363378-Chlamydomonas_euryale.AAC.40
MAASGRTGEPSTMTGQQPSAGIVQVYTQQQTTLSPGTYIPSYTTFQTLHQNPRALGSRQSRAASKRPGMRS